MAKSCAIVCLASFAPSLQLPVEDSFKAGRCHLLRLLCSSSRLCEVIGHGVFSLRWRAVQHGTPRTFHWIQAPSTEGVNLLHNLYTISWYHFQIKVFISVPIISKFYLKIAKLLSNRWFFWKWRSRAWPGTKKSSRSTTIRLDAKLVLKSSRGVGGLIAI